MIKPNMPNIPGIGAMTDTLDFVKNLWSNMGLPGMNMPGMNIPGMGGSGLNIPGMVMPTLSVEEINKKISDLKAVESWLALNMNMLRGTIQALEVQAATISTLKSMGETFTNTMNAATKGKPDSATAFSAASTTSAPSTKSAASAPSSANGSSTQGNGNGSGSANSGNGADGSDAEPARRSKSRPPEPTSKDEQDAANLTAPLVNAAAWWNMLQDQFKQAVGNAMTGEPAEEKKAPAKKPAAKPKAKTASGSSSSSTGTAARKRKTTK